LSHFKISYIGVTKVASIIPVHALKETVSEFANRGEFDLQSSTNSI